MGPVVKRAWHHWKPDKAQRSGPPANDLRLPQEIHMVARGLTAEYRYRLQTLPQDRFEAARMSDTLEVETWDECYAVIQKIKREHAKAASTLLFRGQSNATWKLATTDLKQARSETRQLGDMQTSIS
jgi:hypothetical protein